MRTRPPPLCNRRNARIVRHVVSAARAVAIVITAENAVNALIVVKVVVSALTGKAATLSRIAHLLLHPPFRPQWRSTLQ